MLLNNQKYIENQRAREYKKLKKAARCTRHPPFTQGPGKDRTPITKTDLAPNWTALQYFDTVKKATNLTIKYLTTEVF